MGTYTARLGLYKPDRTEVVNLQDDINQAKDVLDNAVDRICTSTTRPSTPFIGMRCYETDTRSIIVCSQVTPSVVWVKPYADISVADKDERDALSNVYEGLQIYRRDIGQLEVYSGGRWKFHNMAIITDWSQIPDPYVGQTVVHRDDGRTWTFTSSGWVMSSYLGVGGHSLYTATTAGTTSLPSGGYYDVNYDSVVISSWDVSRSPDNPNAFVLNKPGIWAIDAGIRLDNGGTGPRQVFLRVGNIDRTQIFRNASSHPNNGVERATISTNFHRRFPEGQTILVEAFQDSGTSLTVDVKDESTAISFTWLRP